MSTLVASNLQASGGGGTAATLASINGGPLAGFRNLIINGGMDFGQRGDTFASPANGSYMLDRWITNWDGSGATRTVSRQAFAAGSTDAFPGAAFYMRWAQTVAGTGATYNTFSQRIESVSTFAGQTVTISFWARAAASLTMPQISFRQNFGTGGSAIVDTSVVTNIAITTTWTRYSYTVTLPSISGKTVGTSSYLDAFFYLPINTTFTFEITGVQVEVGSVATPFERRFASVELALCQRYYYLPSETRWDGYATNGVTYSNMSYFKQTMRAVPTVSVTNTAAVAFPSTASTVAITTERVVMSRMANATAAGLFADTYTASAEL